MAVDLPVVPSNTVAQARTLWSDAIGGAIASITALAAGIANIVYVSKGGNDSTGVRGSIVHPFLTVQAAMNAAQAGDVVLVGPGTFTESITWPSVNNIALVGAGRGKTTITQTTTPITFTHSFAYAGVRFQDLTLATTSASKGCFIYAPTVPANKNSFPSTSPLVFCRVEFVTVVTADSIELNTLNSVVFEDCQCVNGAVSPNIYLQYVANAVIVDCDFFGMRITFDLGTTDPVPTEGLGLISVYASRIGELDVIANPVVFCDRDVIATQISASVVDNAVSTNSGCVEFHGTCKGDVDCEFTATHAATTFFKMTGANFSGTGTMTIKDGSGDSTFSGIALLTNAAVTALLLGAYAKVYAQNAFIGSLTTGGSPVGACERDSIYDTIDFTAGTAVNVTFTCPMLTAGYNVAFEFGSSAAAVAHPVYITNKAATGFTATPAAGGGAATRWITCKQY